MPRTTLDLDPLVLRELKRRGRQEGKSMGELTSELLAHALAAGTASDPEVEPLAWTSRELGKPLVDLEDNEAMRRALDGDE